MQPGAPISPQFASNVPPTVAFIPATHDSRPLVAPTTKSRRMRPTKSITARYVFTLTSCYAWLIILHRNLCAIDWCKEHKGTSDDFNNFWNTLPKDEKDVRDVDF